MRKRKLLPILGAIAAMALGVGVLFASHSSAGEALETKAADTKIDELTFANFTANWQKGSYGNFSWNTGDITSVSGGVVQLKYWGSDKKALRIVWNKPSTMVYPTKLKYGYSLESGQNQDTASKAYNYDETDKPYMQMGGDGVRQFKVSTVSLSSNQSKVVTWFGPSYTTDELRLTGWTIELQATTYTATAKSGTGVKSAFVSTSSTATSGSASASVSPKTTVYHFATLDKGYYAPSGWTLVSGTAATEGAIYRVASYTIGSSNYTFPAANAYVKSAYISLYPNGGDGSMSSTPITYGSSATLKSTTPTRTGYTFAGWNTADDGNGTAYSNTLTVDQVNAIVLGEVSVSKLYAQWTVNSYTVTIDHNGGEGTAQQFSVDYGAAMPDIVPATRAGYNLIGYYDETSGGKLYYGPDGTSIETWDKGQDDILYAQWEAIPVEVILDGNGGYTEITRIYAAYDQEMPIISSIPTRDHYTFIGFFDDSEAGTMYIDEHGLSAKNWDRLEGDTLYAHWAKNLKVSVVCEDVVYDGQPHTLESVTTFDEATEEEITATVLFDAGGGNYTLIEAPTFTDAGAHTIKYRVSKDGYADYYGSVVINIAKADSSYSSLPTAKANLVYTGASQELLDELGSSDYGNMLYKVTKGDEVVSDWSTSAPSVTSAATYKVFYKTSGDANHNAIEASESNYVEVTIAEVDKTDIKAFDLIVKNYVAEITEGYPTIAETLHGVESSIAETVIDNPDVTESAVADALATLQTAYDQAKSDVAEAKINAIGTVHYSPESKALIDDAREAYDALTDEQKALVSNLQTLEDAETLYSSCVDLATQIEAIGDAEDTDAYRAKVAAAHQAYDDASADIQSALSSYLDELIAREAGIDVMDDVNGLGEVAFNDEYKLAIDDVYGNYEALGEGKIYVANADELLQKHADFYTLFNNATEINNLGESVDTAEYREAVALARTHYDAIDEELAALFPADILKNLTDREAAIVVMDKINAIGELEYTPECKALIDDAREAYEALENDQKALVANYGKLVKAEQDYAAVKAVAEEIAAIGDSADTDAFRKAVEDARTHYDALTADQKAFFPADNLKILVDDEAAISVMDKINAIGELAYTPESKALIDAAQEAYDALTADQKPLVMNLEKLTKASGDYDSVDAVAKEILALGESEDTAAYRQAVKDARTHYDALTEFQKSIFPANLLQDLADREGAIVVMDQIAAIGEPEYTQDYIDRVVTALNAYADLTPAEQGYVANYDALSKANSDYSAVKHVVGVVEAIGDSADTDAFREAVEDARSQYGELTAEQKAFFPEEVLKILVGDEAAISVMDKINAIGAVTYTDASKAKIDEAQIAYNALTDDQKALVMNLEKLTKAIADYDSVDAVVDEINNLIDSEDSEAYRTSVEDAREHFEALSDYQKGIFPEDVLKNLTDREAAIDVMDAINEIGELEYTAECQGLIENAREAYEALENDQKALVANYGKLVKAEQDYAAVKAVAEEIAAIGDSADTDAFRDAVKDAREHYDALTDDQKVFFPADILKTLVDDEAAISVMDKINDIGELAYTPESKALIDAAQEAYDALTADQKALVMNLEKLTKASEDYAAVDQVVNEIEALAPSTDSEAYRTSVEDAREHYAALTDDQKAFFPEDVLKNLTDREAAINVMDKINEIGDLEYTSESKALIDDAREAYDALEGDQKALVANYGKLTKAEQDYAAVKAVAEEIAAIGDPADSKEFRDAVKDAREAYEALSDDQKAFFPADILKTLVDDEAAITVMDKINAIGDVEYTPESKALIDEAKVAYDELKDDQQPLVKNTEKLTKAIADYEAVDAVAKQIQSIGDPADSKEFRDAVKDAREAYEALSDDQKAFFPADILKTLVDDEAAITVMDKINAIADVEYTPESKALIDAAQEAYNALTDDQKALVANYDKLTKASDDYDSVDAAEKKILAIGDIALGDDSGSRIEAARTCYDSLSDAQKAIFPTEALKALTDYEKAYEGLKLIDAIGTVKYDTECEEAIEAARAYYDALSDEQKTLIHDKDLTVLVQAETTYAEQKQSASVVSIVFLVLSCLTLVAGIVFLLFLSLKKKRKDGDSHNGAVKTMSFAGLFPIHLLISHYVDPIFVVDYVIAALAVCIWIAILVIFLRRKKGKKPEPEAPVAEEPAEVPSEEPEAPATDSVAAEEASEPEKELAVETVVEDGVTFRIRYIHSFLAKLIQSPDETKANYNVLKNELLSYKPRPSSRVSWHYESFNVGRNQVAKLAVRGKTLVLFLALDPEGLDHKYRVERARSSRFASVPCAYRIRNARRLRYAKQLIAMAMEKAGAAMGKAKNEEYKFPYEKRAALLKKGLVKESKTRIRSK